MSVDNHEDEDEDLELTWDFDRFPGRGYDDSRRAMLERGMSQGQWEAEERAARELIRDFASIRRRWEAIGKEREEAPLKARLKAVLATKPYQEPARAPIVWRAYLARVLAAYDGFDPDPEVQRSCAVIGEFCMRVEMRNLVKYLQGELGRANGDPARLEAIRRKTIALKLEARTLGLIE